jgi:hypothetical protein
MNVVTTISDDGNNNNIKLIAIFIMIKYITI